jgi:large repetitive protein
MENPDRRRALHRTADVRRTRAPERIRIRLLSVAAVAVVSLALLASQAANVVVATPAGATTTGSLGLSIAVFGGDTASTPAHAVLAGGDVTYQVTVTNPTSAAQSDVSVPVTLPSRFVLADASVAASSGVTSVSAGILNWTVASLDAGSSATLTYTETSDAPPATETNATTAAAASDQSAADATAATSVDVVPAASLGIAVTDGITAVTPGGNDTYVITVTNQGPSEVPDATVTDTFDAPFAATGEFDNVGASFTDLGGGQFQWAGIDLASGASATLEVAGTVPATVATGSSFVSLATVATGPGEIDTNPVASDADADVVAGPATAGGLGLSFATYAGDTASGTPIGTVRAGADVTERLTVTNETVATQTNVSVRVTPPPAFALDAGPTVSDGNTTTTGAVVTWSIASLAPAQSAILTLTETADSPSTMTSDTTNASASSDQSPDAAPSLAGVEVIPASGLSVAVTDGNDTVWPGAPDTYAITLSNDGPSAVTGATLADALSQGFTPLFAVSSLNDTSFSDLGGNQFEWGNIDLASGQSATFTLMGTVSPFLTAGGTFTDVVTAWPSPSSVGTGASSSALDADAVIGAPQAITFTPPAFGLVGDSSPLAASGGGSGDPVVFSVDPSSGAGVCAVSGTNGTTLAYDAPGTCVVDADQAGNASYAAASEVTVRIVVDQAPSFTAASPPTDATSGQPYDYTFAAAGVPAPNFALAAGAPAWLAIDGASGALTGTPPAGTSTFTYEVVASNAGAATTAGPFTVSVSSPAPSGHRPNADLTVSLSCPASVQVRRAATCTFTARNLGPAAADRVIAALALPYRSTVISATPGGRWRASTGFWMVGSLAPDASLQFSVRFMPTLHGRGDAAAGVFSRTHDTEYANNVVRVRITVTG